MNPLSKIPDNELTHTLYLKGVDRAEAERDWVIMDNQRPVVLAQVTQDIVDDENCSHAVAEKKARISSTYKDFLIKLGEAKYQVMLSRAKYDAVDHEIRQRINRSFQDRTDYQGGRLST